MTYPQFLNMDIARANSTSDAFGGSENSLDNFAFSTYGRGRDRAVADAAVAWIREQSAAWLAWVTILNRHDIYSFPRARNLEALRTRSKLEARLDGWRAPLTRRG